MTKTEIKKCDAKFCVHYQEEERCNYNGIAPLYVTDEGKCSEFKKQFIPFTDIFGSKLPAMAA